MNLINRIIIGFGFLFPYRVRNVLFRATGMKIGNNVRITHGFYIDRPDGLELGNDCFINHYCHFHNGADKDTMIRIGNSVFIGPEVKIICSTHEFGTDKQRAGKTQYASVIIEDGVWIGAGVTILPGIRISKGCIIAAGSIVTKSTKADGLYMGIPSERRRDLS